MPQHPSVTLRARLV